MKIIKIGKWYFNADLIVAFFLDDRDRKAVVYVGSPADEDVWQFTGNEYLEARKVLEGLTK